MSSLDDGQDIFVKSCQFFLHEESGYTLMYGYNMARNGGYRPRIERGNKPKLEKHWK